MSLTAILLIVVSAFTHAGWNLLSKRQRPEAAFFLVGNVIGSFALLPVVVPNLGEYARYPLAVWALIAATGICQAVYFWALAGAYRAGHMTVAYPLARSSPVIVVTVVGVFMGHGDQIGVTCVAGILLVVGGCFLVPMKKFRELRLRNYINATCGLALLAAAGTAGYSILDDEALRVLRGGTTALSATMRITVLYLFVEASSASIWLAAALVPTRTGRRRIIDVLRHNAAMAATAGVAIYFTYALVLASMAFVKNVSYVVAFRQLSIPLGAVMGVLLLREPAHRPKLVGAVVIFIGLVLVGIG
jgi:drug/metabolite transporter (DMT)-like permease